MNTQTTTMTPQQLKDIITGKTTDTYILPAHWASALINDDRSGLTDADEQELDHFIENSNPGHCVACTEEQYFSAANDARTLACDVLEYTFTNI